MSKASHRRRMFALAQYRSDPVFRSAYPVVESLLGYDLEPLIAGIIKKAEAGDRTAQRLVDRHHLMERDHR
jgi:hypothetical protein